MTGDQETGGLVGSVLIRFALFRQFKLCFLG